MCSFLCHPHTTTRRKNTNDTSIHSPFKLVWELISYVSDTHRKIFTVIIKVTKVTVVQFIDI